MQVTVTKHDMLKAPAATVAVSLAMTAASHHRVEMSGLDVVGHVGQRGEEFGAIDPIERLHRPEVVCHAQTEHGRRLRALRPGVYDIVGGNQQDADEGKRQ